MSMFTRRIASAVIAAAVIGSMALEPSAFAQSPTVGPAGGVTSTTAPSNSEGTPSGGTGTLGTTRVGPSGVAPAVPYAETQPAPVVRRRRVRRTRRHRTYRRPAAADSQSQDVGTQSQTGPNGSVPPATR